MDSLQMLDVISKGYKSTENGSMADVAFKSETYNKPELSQALLTEHIMADVSINATQTLQSTIWYNKVLMIAPWSVRLFGLREVLFLESVQCEHSRPYHNHLVGYYFSVYHEGMHWKRNCLFFQGPCESLYLVYIPKSEELSFEFRRRIWNCCQTWRPYWAQMFDYTDEQHRVTSWL